MEAFLSKLFQDKLPVEMCAHIAAFIGPTHLTDAIKENHSRALIAMRARLNQKIELQRFRARVYNPKEYAWQKIDSKYYYCVPQVIWNRRFVKYVQQQYVWSTFTPELQALYQELYQQGIMLSVRLHTRACCVRWVTLFAHVGHGVEELL